MLIDFSVLRDDGYDLHKRVANRGGVSLCCFDGNRTVLALILHEALENRFARNGLTRDEGNQLVEGDITFFREIISKKYRQGDWEPYPQSEGARSYPLVFVTISDLSRFNAGT